MRDMYIVTKKRKLVNRKHLVYLTASNVAFRWGHNLGKNQIMFPTFQAQWEDIFIIFKFRTIERYLCICLPKSYIQF